MLGTLDFRKGLRALLPQILGAAICAYFVYHAVQGDRGLIVWLQLSRELAESQAVLADLSAERAALEHRVSLLRPESLDPDMLEEQARIMLNFGGPDDRTLLLPPGPAPASHRRRRAAGRGHGVPADRRPEVDRRLAGRQPGDDGEDAGVRGTPRCRPDHREVFDEPRERRNRTPALR